ncbi:hypothetical protein [Paraburkholderia phosphatilytica]|uniref:hypothetical protein n=1 Tax=Paraburkholderia phosphatilytica TaxID=2282883 RepID=UPI000E4C223F|nr:hypothetical protein [Paraburkholderia phosphatilytica]
MTPEPDLPLSTFASTRFEALPNPRGGTVRPAEIALADAQHAFDARHDTASALLRAVLAFREAGWLSAQRFADTLVLMSPLVVNDGADNAALRASFGAALQDFRHAVSRHNLREQSCSPTLFTHYTSLNRELATRIPGSNVSFEDFALAGRPIAPSTMRPMPAAQLSHLRACYEQALLPALRRANGHDADDPEANAHVQAAFDVLDACLAQLAGDYPYDFWRLARACARALRATGNANGLADARRFYARCNLALADHAHGLLLAPRSLVRVALALLWRDYALFGAAAEDADEVELLHDYGLTVGWHVVGTQASEVLWEAATDEAGSAAAHDPQTRSLGALSVNANAYEDFLQTADVAIASLADYAQRADQPEKADASAALQAGDAAYRLGAAASALGLGHVALLADALGLAWRRRAHAEVNTSAVREASIVEPPDAGALHRAALALQAMLHKIAAGLPPTDGSAALAALTRVIERGAR